MIKSPPEKRERKKRTSWKKTLSIRQIKYKKYRLEGCSKYSAARLAGYSHSTADRAKQSIEKFLPNWQEELEMAGLTKRSLTKHALEGLNATKIQSCQILVRTEDGKIIVNKNSDDFIEVPDWNTREKYFKHIKDDLGLTLPKPTAESSPLIDQSVHYHLVLVLTKEEYEKGQKHDQEGDLHANTETECRLSPSNE